MTAARNDEFRRAARDENLNSETEVTCSFRFFTTVSVLLAILTLFPLLQTGFTTHDDTRIALRAGDSIDYLAEAVEGAKGCIPYLSWTAVSDVLPAY